MMPPEKPKTRVEPSVEAPTFCDSISRKELLLAYDKTRAVIT
jgi:hypothetical protein